MDALGIEAVRRLVEDQDLGLAEQRRRESETLAHPEREPFDSLVRGVRESDELEHLVDPPARHIRRGGKNAKVIARLATRMEPGRLQHRPDVPKGVGKL